MDTEKTLKLLEMLTGRVMELESDLVVSRYQINKLKDIIEKAENEAGNK